MLQDFSPTRVFMSKGSVTLSTLKLVFSQIALIVFMLEIRWARIAFATSFASSEEKPSTLRNDDLGIHLE